MDHNDTIEELGITPLHDLMASVSGLCHSVLCICSVCNWVKLITVFYELVETVIHVYLHKFSFSGFNTFGHARNVHLTLKEDIKNAFCMDDFFLDWRLEYQ